MEVTIRQGETLLLKLPVSAGVLGSMSVTFPGGAQVGTDPGNVTEGGVVKQVRSFAAAAALAVGEYSFPVSFALDGVTRAGTLALAVVSGSVTPDASFTAKGVLHLWGGPPAAGAVLYIGAQVETRPTWEGAAGALDPTRYPSFTPPDGVTEPTPVPLFDSPPASLSVLQTGGGVPLRRVTTDSDGAFSCVLPTPQALAYAAGARTDADMDATRGGTYSVAYVAVMPDGRLVVFPVDTTALDGDGSLDITPLLATAPL